MRKHHFVALFSIFIALTSVSCKRNKIYKKEIEKDSTVAVLDSAIKSGEMVEAPKKPTFSPTSVDFKYMKIRSKADFSLSGEQQSVNLTANIKKDSLIWLSLGLMGVEGGRGIITRDSIFFIDRLHRNYYKLDFASLSKRFNFNLNFDIIQAILIGNMPINNQLSYEFTEEGDIIIVTQDEDIVQIENHFQKPTKKLEKVFAIDSSGKSRMQIDYDNFVQINNYLIPHEVSARIDATTKDKIIKTLVNLQYTKVEITDQNPGFNFSIPKNYTPVILKK